ncbi:DUF6705 family protein [Chryseobacterium sp. MYb328]|uniref:DUF6705 family protein n=1 Tax=Chryseobacterium sp. MYb328 TaxID=2745231 RepID=UPI0030B30696
MRNGWIIFGFLVVFSCKAQQVLPLNTSGYSSPTNSYFKDSDNELDYYTGTWTGHFQDKTIILQISKQIKIPIERFRKSFYRDQIFVKYEIKKNNVILESTINHDFSNDLKLSIDGSKTQDNGDKVTLVFAGGNCSVGIGTIVLKKINPTQFSWGYYPGTTTRNDKDCPPTQDYTIYLPETENLIFTKQ